MGSLETTIDIGRMDGDKLLCKGDWFQWLMKDSSISIQWKRTNSLAYCGSRIRHSFTILAGGGAVSDLLTSKLLKLALN